MVVIAKINQQIKKLDMKKIFLGTLLALSSIACQKQEIPYYVGDSSANFWAHSQNHSLFGATATELPQDTITLNISLVGQQVDYDRVVKMEAYVDPAGTAADKLRTTATPSQYQLLEGIIPANALIGKIKLVVKNEEVLAKGELKLRVKMIETKDFKVGLRENNYIDLKWSRMVLQPPTWRAMRFFFCATYSTQVYRIFMEVTGLKEFYYYEGEVSAEEGNVMGTNFAKRVRELSVQQGSPLLHDDGPSKGQPIVPIF